MAAVTLEHTDLRPDRGASLGPGDGPTLLVASTGGHLEQLLRLRDRLGPDALGPTEWVTFDGNQSRALLRGETVHHVDYIRPRDLGAALRAAPAARRLLKQGGYRAVVSTGAGIALPFFVAAAARRLPRYYIESAARSLGPSLTGRLVAAIPGTRLFTQYPSWADERWTYCGSLFDAFVPGVPDPSRRTDAPRRVVVTLGTMPDYGFRRAVERLAHLLPQVCAPDAEVLWQVGATDVTGLGVDGHVQVPADKLRAAVREADLVIAHGGIGSALMALDAGRVPVLVPRRTGFGEHIDDHQAMICGHLADRGIAVSREADELTADDLLRAARATVGASSRVTMRLTPSGSATPRGRRPDRTPFVMPRAAAAPRRIG
ncbi:MAG: glycosyl transferase family 28 [Micrococcales bacterium]|nr:glycosyl transferase family 28 [Micrococcales bacterium]